MSYVELLVCILVATIVLSSAVLCLSTTLSHMNWLMKVNREALKEFHFLNFVRFDYVDHSRKSGFRKFGTMTNSSYLDFMESVDGVTKKVRYRVSRMPSGHTLVERQTFSLANVHLNTRRFVLESAVMLDVSARDGKIFFRGEKFGEVVIPLQCPDVAITSVSVRKKVGR